MTHNVIVQLRVGGNACPLSTGIPVWRGFHQVTTPELQTSSPELGVVTLVLGCPDPGPADRRQRWSKPTAGSSPRLRHVLREWLDERRSVAYARKSSPALFWVASETPTHLLMDAVTRQLVAVEPFDPELSGPVWGRIAQGFTDPQKFIYSPYDREEGESHQGWQHPWEYAMRCRLGEDNTLYACLHPAPIVEGPAPLWCWDGLNAIRISYDEDVGFESQFLIDVEKEQILGAADLCCI